MLTAERVRELLNYDPETGVFQWRKPRAQAIGKSEAGTINASGYRIMNVAGKLYRAHRLAWLYVYGEMPDGMIDHINGVRSDNRIANLRLADNGKNQMNAKRRSDNKSGYRGVSWHRKASKWSAEIWCDGEKHYLGLFECEKDAHAARVEAAKRLHGEFARVN